MRAAAERSVGILPAFSHGATRRALKTLRLALRTLIAHKLRTTLSLLGITIGVASVITMLAIGQGTRAEVLRQLESFGTNLVLVSAGQVKTFAGRERQVGNVTTLTLQDAEAIAEECSGVMRVAPAQQQKLPVKYEDNTTTTNVLGTTPDFAEVRNFQAARGEFLTDEYLTASARVAVLGQTVVENLFGGSDPLGERIRIQRVPFTVIGVLTQKGLDLSGNDQDDVILIPVTTALRRVFNLDHLNVVSDLLTCPPAGMLHLVRVFHAEQQPVTRLREGRVGGVDGRAEPGQGASEAGGAQGLEEHLHQVIGDA